MVFTGIFGWSGKIKSTLRTQACLLGLVLAAAPAGALDWGGSASASYGDTRNDSSTTSTLDQQYSLHGSAQPLPAFQYFATLRFRRLQSQLADTFSTWQTEFSPTVAATWMLPFLKVRSEYSYRDNQDGQSLQEITARGANVAAQTTWTKLPRLYGRYDWNQNMHDLDLLGSDTRQTALGAGLEYRYRASAVRYDFSERLTKSQATRLEQISRYHTGRFDHNTTFADKLVSVQTSYRIVAKQETERHPGDDEIYLPLVATSGLYGVDPTPDFDALASQSTLVDGVLDSAASRLLDLSSGEAHNFGLDFGAAVEIDRLFLYTDTLASPVVRWAVYTSPDNQSWTLARAYQSDPFSRVFSRYEVAFPRQTTRYVKLVQAPLLSDRPVLVTELRGLILRGDAPAPAWAADHQGSLRTSIRPARWLSMDVEGSVIRTEAGPTSVARHQDGVVASLRVAPDPRADLAGQFQVHQTNYPGSVNPNSTSELKSLTLRSLWLPALQTAVAASQQQEASRGRRSRRLESGSVRVQATLLPDLSSLTEVGVATDYRYATGEQMKTRYLSEAVSARPVDRLQLAGDFRQTWLDAANRRAPAFRTSLSLRAQLRITAAISAQGDWSRQQETGAVSAAWDAVLSWLPAPKLTLSTSASRVEPTVGEPTLLLSTQASYRPTPRMDVTGGYSYFDAGDTSAQNYSNLRLGVSLSF